ncbi:trypsin-like serine protease [Streptomyces sp. NC-S4]
MGPEAPADQYAYTARLVIGDEAGGRGCTGTLLDASWVLTAASCFAATPGATVPAGKPALKTTATLSNGKAVEITEIAPRADRDVVLARLATQATSLTPVKLASAAPAAGADVTAAGFGRTKTEWVPGKLHTGSFTVKAADGAGLTITGKGTDSICKGDTGGPLLNAAGELVGVNSRSWQGGCLGVAPSETRTSAIAARTDNLAQWIADILRGEGKGDANGDGRTDAMMAYHHADGSIGFYSSLADTTGHLGAFNVGYKVPASGGWVRDSMRLISGDFNGDHRSDIAMMYRHTDGSITLHTGLANTEGLIQPFTESSYRVPANSWDWNAIQLLSGDVNGDGRTDAMMAYHHSDGSIGFYSSLADTTGHLGAFNVGYKVPASGGWVRDSMRLISGDFNGDHRSDIAMMYRHTNGSITLHTGLANTEGLIQPFTESSYRVPANSWDWNAIQLLSGDVNGDGRTDAMMAYHHADGSIGFYSSLADTTGHLGAFNVGYKVPASGGWVRDSMRLISGDFNGDHRSDIAMMYRHTNGSITLHTGLANTEGLIQPFTESSYSVPANSWDWNAIQLLP